MHADSIMLTGTILRALHVCGTREGCAPATELYTGIPHLHMALVVTDAVLAVVVMYTHATDCWAGQP